MSDPADMRHSRRELMRALGRGAALGCLCVIGAVTTRRSRRVKREGACADPSVCRACGAVGRCGLQPARAARQERKEKQP